MPSANMQPHESLRVGEMVLVDKPLEYVGYLRTKRMQRASSLSRTVRLFKANFPGVTGAAVHSALTKSRGQLNQDVFALCANGFARNGFYLDIGASDGLSLSNSLLLERNYGWSGIAIEPDPKAARQLRRSRRCVVVESAVTGAQTPGSAFLVQAGVLSALSDHLPDDQHSEERARISNEVKVSTVSLNTVLEQHASRKKIDFLSLDIEGLELAVLESLDWQKWEVQAIAVEHNFTVNNQLIEAFLVKQGFRRVLAELSDFDGWFIKQ